MIYIDRLTFPQASFLLVRVGHRKKDKDSPLSPPFGVPAGLILFFFFFSACLSGAVFLAGFQLRAPRACFQTFVQFDFPVPGGYFSSFRRSADLYASRFWTPSTRTAYSFLISPIVIVSLLMTSPNRVHAMVFFFPFFSVGGPEHSISQNVTLMADCL